MLASPPFPVSPNSIVLPMPRPSLHHSMTSTVTTPPISLRDPFDDGVNSFAHDPFANDGGSDPDEGTENANGLNHGELDEVAPDGSLRRDAVERDAEGSTDNLIGEGRRRASTSTGNYGYDLQRPWYPSTSTPSHPDQIPHIQHQHSSSSSIPQQASDTDEDGDPALAPSGLLPPSPPPFLRAFSAPVQPSKLGNLNHPNRRPSASGRHNLATPPFFARQFTQNSELSTSRSDSHMVMSRRQSSTTYTTADEDFPNSFPSPTLGSISSTSFPSHSSFLAGPDNQQTGLFTLSLELADSIQAAIQTLLQLTPIHLFDSAKEQFSACSVQVPVTSLTSLLTAMKNLNYLSEHIAPLCTDETLTRSPGVPRELGGESEDEGRSRNQSYQSEGTERHVDLSAPTSPIDTFAPPSAINITLNVPHPLHSSPNPLADSATRPRNLSTTSIDSLTSEPDSMLQEFDVGEMVQSVGDLVGGLAAQAGVDLVLFHGDVGMKHVNVKGDEGGVCYVLSHVSVCLRCWSENVSC